MNKPSVDIPPSQCNFAVKQKDVDGWIHCRQTRGHDGKHSSPVIDSKKVETEGEWVEL